MKLSEAIEGFMLDSQIRNKSESTLEYYAIRLAKFQQFIGDPPVEQLTTNDLRRYLLYVKEKGLAEWTVLTYYKHIKTFIRWCWQEGMIQNIIAPIPAPRVSELMPKFLDEVQIKKLFRLLKLDRTRTGLRNYTIFAVFMDTGMRSNELAHLRLEDVSLNELHLMITTAKWRKQRPVPISPQLKRILWKYIADYRAQLNPRDTDFLFVNHEGRPYKASGIQHMVRRMLSNIKVKGATHLLRHTFATMYLRSGGDLESLRIILGHTSLSVTQRYTHLVTEDLVKSHVTHSPLASL